MPECYKYRLADSKDGIGILLSVTLIVSQIKDAGFERGIKKATYDNTCCMLQEKNIIQVQLMFIPGGSLPRL